MGKYRICKDCQRLFYISLTNRHPETKTGCVATVDLVVLITIDGPTAVGKPVRFEPSDRNPMQEFCKTSRSAKVASA